MMRGISYSPVPTGEDPGYALPYGDYFTSQYEPLFARDLALMAEMGANTVRVYTWSTSARHGTFLDMAHHLGLAVVAVFEMGTAEQTPLVEPRDLAYAQTRLQAKVRATGGHPAVVSWLIGNELNGAWNAFVCDKEYEEETLQAPGAHSGLAHCAFGDDAWAFVGAIDALCHVVAAEGLLCSTPLAGIKLPNRYYWAEDNCPFKTYSVNDWYALMEGAGRELPDFVPANFTVQYISYFAANLYPGRNFESFDFAAYGAASSKPFVVSEYGVDAYETYWPGTAASFYDEGAVKGATPLGRVNEGMQADWVLQLVEDLERHSPTCVAGCAEPRVASGGALIGWADELWKGRVIDSSAFDNRTARLRQQLCPDADAWLQTPCGYPSPAQPDTYVNEEYFGIFAVNASCRVGDVTVDRLRPASRRRSSSGCGRRRLRRPPPGERHRRVRPRRVAVVRRRRRGRAGERAPRPARRGTASTARCSRSSR